MAKSVADIAPALINLVHDVQSELWFNKTQAYIIKETKFDFDDKGNFLWAWRTQADLDAEDTMMEDMGMGTSRIEFENLASLEEFHSHTPTMLLQRPMDNMSTGTILESFKLGTANDDDSTIASDASPSTPTQQQVDSVSPVVHGEAGHPAVTDPTA